MTNYIKPEGKSSIEAATEAIAKVNAMLIAKGKLKPSQVNSTIGWKKTSGSQNNLITTEVDINDVPIGCRNMLTRGSTQEEISKMSGAAVATRGRYLSAEERARNPSERALYLSVQATTQEAVDLAVGRINEIIANGLARQGAKTSRFSPAGGFRAPSPHGPRPNFNTMPPPPVQPVAPPVGQNISVLQEKLYIGLEHAPPNFSVKDKVLGPGASFLQHIQAETGAKVSLRGKGSSFIEPNGAEAPEPMHVHIQHMNMMGLQQAKDLATNLIQTVQQEYAAFQQSFVTMPPPNLIPQPPLMIPPPQIVSLAQPPPLLPGQQVVSVPMSSMAPPMPLLQPPPQTTLLPPPPVPGQIIQQPHPVQAFAPPSSVGQPMQQPHPVQTFAPPSSVGQPMQQPHPVQQFAPRSSVGQPIQQFVQSSEQPIMASQQQILVSLPPGQQPGQMVISSMNGQPLPQPQQVQQVTQIQQPVGPPGSIQIQHQPPGLPPQPTALAQPQLQAGTIQQATLHQQAGMQQPQITLQQQQPLQQQTILQQTGLPSSQPQLIQQPPPPPGMQQMPVSIQPIQQHSPQPVQPLQQQQALQPQQQTVSVQQPQQQLISVGQTMVQTGIPTSATWGTPAPASYSPTPPAHSFSMAVGQPSQSNGSVIMSTPLSQPTVSSMSTSPVSSSGYVYNPGPREEPKRRFTEVKQEDKVPENLLGYEHGPPHLANLVVQPGQSQQPQPPAETPTTVLQVSDSNLQPQAQQYEGLMTPNYRGQVLLQHQPGGVQSVTVSPVQHIQQVPQQGYEQQRGELEERVQVASLVTSPGPQPVYTQTNGDKILMPPPPPPSIGVKRQASSLSPQAGPEPRKKGKGFQDEEEEDLDIPSSMATQGKEFKKYSYNQYSSTPQLYMTQSDSQGQPFEQVSGLVPQPPTVTYEQLVVQPVPGQVLHGSQSPSPLPGEQVNIGYQRDTVSPVTQYQQQSQYQPEFQPRVATSVYIAAPSQPPPPPQQAVFGQAGVTQTYIHYTPPPPPPVIEEPAPQGQEDPALKDNRDGRGFNVNYIPYTREDKNPIHQPPPPPPPPRSYW